MVFFKSNIVENLNRPLEENGIKMFDINEIMNIEINTNEMKIFYQLMAVKQFIQIYSVSLIVFY